ncbi:hypothetical protein [Devosia submarina]|uniref:hypothetical protein n=1 Tax=Devosia submarina TaxID=1173082 RepID=UPI001300B14C|nr:hypothetical protein [Devosia submarina]
MSKTLAVEIADRTLAIVNPANRALALRAALQRHGFAAREPELTILQDNKSLRAWLLTTYAPPAS